MKPVFLPSCWISSLINRVQGCKERPFFNTTIIIFFFFFNFLYFIWSSLSSLTSANLSLQQITSLAKRITNNLIILALGTKEPLRKLFLRRVFCGSRTLSIDLCLFRLKNSCDLTSTPVHDGEDETRPIKEAWRVLIFPWSKWPYRSLDGEDPEQHELCLHISLLLSSQRRVVYLLRDCLKTCDRFSHSRFFFLSISPPQHKCHIFILCRSIHETISGKRRGMILIKNMA